MIRLLVVFNQCIYALHVLIDKLPIEAELLLSNCISSCPERFTKLLFLVCWLEALGPLRSLGHGVASTLDRPLNELDQLDRLNAGVEPGHLLCIGARDRFFHVALGIVDQVDIVRVELGTLLCVVEIKWLELVIYQLASVGHQIVVVLCDCVAVTLLRREKLQEVLLGDVPRVNYLVRVQVLQAPVTDLCRVLRLLSWREHLLASKVKWLPGHDDLLQIRRWRVSMRPGAASAQIR